MTIRIGVELEKINALKDAQDYVVERGNEITILLSSEAVLERSKYGGIIKRDPTPQTFHAYPIIYNPTKDQLEKAGIKETVDVLVTTATKDWTDRSLSFEDIDHIRDEISINIDPDANTNSEKYIIRDLQKLNMFSHTYLNIILGLVRKV